MCSVFIENPIYQCCLAWPMKLWDTPWYKNFHENFQPLPLHPPLFSLLLCDVTPPQTHTDIWQHNTTPQVPSCSLIPPPFPFTPFYVLPLRITILTKHTLLPRSASLAKQGSDWMMPGCRCSALFKSIFPTASLPPASLLRFPLTVLISAFPAPLARLSSGTSFTGVGDGSMLTFLCTLFHFKNFIAGLCQENVM